MTNWLFTDLFLYFFLPTSSSLLEAGTHTHTHVKILFYGIFIAKFTVRCKDVNKRTKCTTTFLIEYGWNTTHYWLVCLYMCFSTVLSPKMWCVIEAFSFRRLNFHFIFYFSTMNNGNESYFFFSWYWTGVRIHKFRRLSDCVYEWTSAETDVKAKRNPPPIYNNICFGLVWNANRTVPSILLIYLQIKWNNSYNNNDDDDVKTFWVKRRKKKENNEHFWAIGKSKTALKMLIA